MTVTITQAIHEDVVAEREACARVAEMCKTIHVEIIPRTSQEQWEDFGHDSACDWVAKQIRARQGAVAVATAVVQIGNSDDRLTQVRWAEFANEVDGAVAAVASEVHFHGLSAGDEFWQNACWVFDLSSSFLPELKETLAKLALKYKQDSIALTLGTTEFVESVQPHV